MSELGALSTKNLDALLEHLGDGDELAEICNHTLQMTRKFLRRRGVLVAEAIAWLEENGAHCDCEVALNLGDECASGLSEWAISRWG